MAREAAFRLTAHGGFDAMVRFLREYGELFHDAASVRVLLDAVDPGPHTAAPSPPAPMWDAWLQAIDLAVRQPELDRPRGPGSERASFNAGRSGAGAAPAQMTAMTAYDAMIRFLEHLSGQFQAAEYFLAEIWYSEIEPSAGLNTRDPATWYDWLRHARAAIRPQDRP